MAGKHDKTKQADLVMRDSGDGGARHIALPDKGRSRTVLIAIGLTVVALSVIYLVGVLVFSRMLFLPGTSINGEDVSLRSVSSVAAAHHEEADDYELSVSGQGLDLSVPAKDVGLTSDGDAYVADALSQVNPWAWPTSLLSTRSLEVDESTAYDMARLGELVDTAVNEANEGATAPIDARAAYDEALAAYVVQPEQLGTEINAEEVTRRVAEALTGLESSLRLSDDVLVRPAILSDDDELNAAVDHVNSQLGATQTLTVAGAPVFEVDQARIASWVSVDDELQATLNSEAVKGWAQGELSTQLDSVGSERHYTRPDGKVVSVSGGTYGWVIAGEELSQLICANIREGKKAEVEIPMLEQAAAWSPGGQDWPARYIDIDLSEQHVRLYDDGGGQVWESDCVSGNSSAGHDTPTGVYAINDNMASGNVELRGRIDPATNEPEYISYVTYWMPFIDNAWALHDASWRYSFGGDIYRYNGSHGCVNLPSDAAERLYSMVRVGDVVVVHY